MAAVKHQLAPGNIAADLDIVVALFCQMNHKALTGIRMNPDRHIKETAIDARQGHFFLYRAVFHDGILPHGFNFPHGMLHEPSVFDEQLPGHAHLGIPGMPPRCLFAGLPVVHPPDHDPASIRCYHCLGCVIGKPQIHRLDRFPMKVAVRFVKGPDKGHGPVPCVEFLPCVHFLWADQKDPFFIQPEEIRAFPHPSVFLIAGIDLPDKMPVDSIPAAEIQNRSLSFTVPVGNHHPQCAILGTPDLGIPEIELAVPIRQMCMPNHRIEKRLFKVLSIPNRHTLRLRFSFEGAGRLHTRIDQHELSIRKGDGAAGKAPAGICCRIRCQGAGHIGPVKEIIAHRMPPVHWPPLTGEGKILIEQMILSLVIAKAIGIIHPAYQGSQVKQRTLVRHKFLRLFPFKYSCPLQRDCMIRHSSSSHDGNNREPAGSR